MWEALCAIDSIKYLIPYYYILLHYFMAQQWEYWLDYSCILVLLRIVTILVMSKIQFLNLNAILEDNFLKTRSIKCYERIP